MANWFLNRGRTPSIESTRAMSFYQQINSDRAFLERALGSVPALFSVNSKGHHIYPRNQRKEKDIQSWLTSVGLSEKSLDQKIQVSDTVVIDSQVREIIASFITKPRTFRRVAAEYIDLRILLSAMQI